MMFVDRHDAGKKLAAKLKEYSQKSNTVVIGLPRGGVVLAYEVAKELKLPLDIIVPRKIGAPSNPEFAIGAITQEGDGIFDDAVISSYNIPQEYIDSEIKKEKQEAKRRLKEYRGKKPPLDLKNKTVIIVDDGIATGATMQAAIISTRKQQAKDIIVAVPVLAPDNIHKIQPEVDQLIYLAAPKLFMAVGNFYKKFDQTTDQEVISLLKD